MTLESRLVRLRVELAEAMIRSVLRSGGAVESVDQHRALGETGGVAASLRYPFPRQGGR